MHLITSIRVDSALILLSAPSQIAFCLAKFKSRIVRFPWPHLLLKAVNGLFLSPEVVLGQAEVAVSCGLQTRVADLLGPLQLFGARYGH